jgi:hypothetical protein
MVLLLAVIVLLLMWGLGVLNREQATTPVVLALFLGLAVLVQLTLRGSARPR